MTLMTKCPEEYGLEEFGCPDSDEDGIMVIRPLSDEFGYEKYDGCQTIRVANSAEK